MKDWLEVKQTCPLCRAVCSYMDLQMIRQIEPAAIASATKLPLSVRSWLESIDPSMAKRVFPVLKVNFGRPDLLTQITENDLVVC